MIDLQSLVNGIKGYSPVGSTTNTNGEQQSLGETLSQYLKSKRVRIVLACVVVFLVGSFTIRLLSPTSLQFPGGTVGDADAFTAPSEAHDPTVDYSQFAYVQYVTNPQYLCNSLMIFESLKRLGSKAERLMMHPNDWSIDFSSTTSESRLLRKARDEYDAKLVPIEVQRRSGDATWGDSFTKLLAFNQTQYKRVLSLDSDATVLKHMDELFLIPPAPVAMPRAYWLNPDDRVLSSQLVLLEPSEFEFKRVVDAMDHVSSGDFDMEIVNNLYKDSCWVIPHRPYDLLSGEFRAEKHKSYLGSEEEVWNGEAVIKEASFLHFSDWPYPKPWITTSQSNTDERKPKCRPANETAEEDCTDQKIWLWLYDDFRDRRQSVCSLGPSDAKRDLELEARVPRSPFEPIF